MRFRQYLKEEETHPEWMLKSEEEIMKLLGTNNAEMFMTRSFGDDFIGVQPNPDAFDRPFLKLTEENLLKLGGKYYIGFQIIDPGARLIIDCNGAIGSLKGLPGNLNTTLTLDAKSINFDYLPYLNGKLELGSTTNFLKGLKGIGKAKTVVEHILLGPKIESNILGLLKFNYKRRGGNQVMGTGTGISKGLAEACRIISYYIESDLNPSNRDIIECQEELLDAGLENYAKL